MATEVHLTLNKMCCERGQTNCYSYVSPGCLLHIITNNATCILLHNARAPMFLGRKPNFLTGIMDIKGLPISNETFLRA